jgi:hypothetical protein
MGSAKVGIEGPGCRGAAHARRPLVRMADGQPGARRTFVVVDITEIYVQWYAGRATPLCPLSVPEARTRELHLRRGASGSGCIGAGMPSADRGKAELWL